ncbi:MAG: hypothetical protein KBT11_01265 [Treponema sp.]|nr:hypothetical protein [Candidatus Treponema equifaecale]
METVITVAEPTVRDNSPTYSSDDYLTWFCDFLTNDSGNSNLEGGTFLGTDVYYRIYNKDSDLISQRDSINSVNTSSNGNSAATRMVESYKYKPLGLGIKNSIGEYVKYDNGGYVFVPSSSSNRKIRFRPKTYKGSEDVSEENVDLYTMRACVGVGNEYKKTGNAYVIPIRSNGKTFDFFDDDDDDDDETDRFDIEPVSGDEDFECNSTITAENTYYVQFFAVGVAWSDSTCTSIFSLVLDLGSIPIKKGN